MSKPEDRVQPWGAGSLRLSNAFSMTSSGLLTLSLAMVRRTLRTLTALVSVAILTFVAYRVISVNAATVGFLYLLLVLVVASAWGIVEASLASVGSTLPYNFFFLPPIGTFTIADPDNWVALSSFLTTALIASRLSAKAKRRALEAVDRQH